MEIRVLEYFLAVAREQNISRAAGYLHLTQPTLSRQLKELEEELGQQLFVRGNRKITLTQDGMFLRKRAQEIVDLVKKTENEMHAADKSVSGEISIGAAETDAVRTVVQLVRQLQTEHHDIRLHIFSGDAVDTLEKLEKGLIDFAVLVGERDLSKYECLHLPKPDSWGVLMCRDSALAGKTRIAPEDLVGQPLILSRQSTSNRELMAWLQSGGAKPNVTATYNLIYNASLMVDEGMGYALGLDKLISMTGNASLCFVPLDPPVTMDAYIVWKKHQVFSRAAEAFYKLLTESQR